MRWFPNIYLVTLAPDDDKTGLLWLLIFRFENLRTSREHTKNGVERTLVTFDYYYFAKEKFQTTSKFDRKQRTSPAPKLFCQPQNRSRKSNFGARD